MTAAALADPTAEMTPALLAARVRRMPLNPNKPKHRALRGILAGRLEPDVLRGYLWAKSAEQTWTGRPHVTVRVCCARCGHWHKYHDGILGGDVKPGDTRASLTPGDVVLTRATCQDGYERWALVVVQPEPFIPSWQARHRHPEGPAKSHRFSDKFTSEWLPAMSSIGVRSGQ